GASFSSHRPAASGSFGGARRWKRRLSENVISIATRSRSSVRGACHNLSGTGCAQPADRPATSPGTKGPGARDAETVQTPPVDQVRGAHGSPPGTGSRSVLAGGVGLVVVDEGVGEHRPFLLGHHGLF